MIANKLINNNTLGFSSNEQIIVFSNNESYSRNYPNSQAFYVFMLLNNTNGETESYPQNTKYIYNNILNSSKENYKKLYNKQFNFLGYESYLDELKKLPLDKFSKMYLYNDSIRLNINYKSKIFFIEYFKDEKMLIVTSKTDNLKMKETKLGNILSTMESFF
ncbi:MAG: hypothetical protein IJD23_05800 [Spirochaetaceae bacterium]|nr:hypothetical protein [Spirochaetaceae bacterium]